MRFAFDVIARCRTTGARRGRLGTLHGSAETPAFMPVGTTAAVKGLDPDQVRRTGSEVVLCNTYHLALRPGDEVVATIGGLHRFMGWSGPILTDSGGYQVFSLAELTHLDDDGVTFKSHLDGATLVLTPERAMEIQLNLGSDIIMVLDECLPHDADRDRVRRSVYERTIPWAERCLQRHPRDGRALFAIGQGGLDAGIREEHAKIMRGQDFDGFAIGGLSVGETSESFRGMIEVSTAVLPEAKPRYLMGVGSLPEILDAVELGVDMFDCVLPSRNARNGQALTFAGQLRLKNARFTRDPAILDPTCPCSTCQSGFSRSYLRHLVMAKEILGASLMTTHNLTFMQRLMTGIRTALESDTFPEFKTKTLTNWADGRAD